MRTNRKLRNRIDRSIDKMGYRTLTFQCDDEIVTIALSVPEKRNAISAQMIADLLAALDQAEVSPARVVILTGAGKAFCAGMDLDELQHMARQTQQKNLEDARRMTKLLYRLYSFPKPVVAASPLSPISSWPSRKPGSDTPRSGSDLHRPWFRSSCAAESATRTCGT